MAKYITFGEVMLRLTPPGHEVLFQTLTDVECKKGRYDAFVYLDKMMFDEREQAYILDRLKRVSKHLQNHCMAAEG